MNEIRTLRILPVFAVVIGMMGMMGPGMVAGAARAARAQEGGVDHDSARAAVQSGEIMPLHEILAKVSQRFDGRVLEVKLKDQEGGLHGWVYDIRLFTPDDQVVLLRVDAGTATILQIEGPQTEGPQTEGPQTEGPQIEGRRTEDGEGAPPEGASP